MPEGGTRTPLTFSYSWGQSGLEAQFASVFQPGHGNLLAGYPLMPPEPERVRLWDFPVGVNTVYAPRAYEPISFAELRALAEAHDITRLAIETRKDQLEKLDWTIKPRSPKRPAADAASRSDRLARSGTAPTASGPFATWLRETARGPAGARCAALELRRNRGGDIIGLDVVDGATIKLLVDDTGRRPKPPAPAFEQVIHGRPWKLLTADELLYLPRNPRPHKAYGFGPVEQIVMTINIALRRQAMQLHHFTEGNGPARPVERAGRLECRTDPPVPGMVRQRPGRQLSSLRLVVSVSEHLLSARRTRSRKLLSKLGAAVYILNGRFDRYGP